MKKNALLFSGGVESTLLYFILHNQNKNIDLYILNRYNMPLTKASNLYNKLKERWHDNKSTFQILETPKNLDNAEVVIYALDHLSKNYENVYWGINAYPDNIDIRPKYKKHTITNPDAIIERYPNVCTPFLSITKDKVIQKFYEYNINDILKWTHSCGSKFDGPCGTCFNCLEREWAYKQLNLPLERGV